MGDTLPSTKVISSSNSGGTNAAKKVPVKGASRKDIRKEPIDNLCLCPPGSNINTFFFFMFLGND
jgi:hypothetical protein